MSEVPRYVQVARVVEHEIRTGVWVTGFVVPSQVQLAQRFGVARTTAAKAQKILIDRRLVTAVPGVGLVVTKRGQWPAE